MIKLQHRKHMNTGQKDSKIVVYYSAGEIFLGVVLVILAVYFAYNYDLLNGTQCVNNDSSTTSQP